jgi:hypothetical protein
MEEFKLQAQCFQYHWNNYPNERGLLFTVNNNSGSRKEGAVMKAMGVVAGGPVFLEFKTATGRQSPAQKRFQEIVESQGYQYHIIRNFHDFRTAIGK